MPGILVDSCALRHWLSWKANKPFDNDRLKFEAEAFDVIFGRVAKPGTTPFLYNARTVIELPDSVRPDFDRVVRPFCVKVPIPLTRADGSYRADGSVLRGGRMGGSLRALLSLDGYDHEHRLRGAARGLRGRKLYDLPERSREFDIEHLESAIEAGAALFVTTDGKLIGRIQRGAAAFPDDPAVTAAARIVVWPSEALARLPECA